MIEDIEKPSSPSSQPRTQVRGADAATVDSVEPSYHDVSILKSPVWKWEIATYFFLGGLSSAAYVLARLAERTGGNKFRALTRVGTKTAFASMLPCAPLLIHDLGDPKRFHHMLRVFKPSSPMNLGTWLLTAYSGAATASVVREYFRDDSKTTRDLASGILLAVHDAAGIPLALGVMGYTGVLLSCTANPMWCKNPWLGPLFTASGFSTGAAAISLALDLAGEDDPASHRALGLIETGARVAEGITLAGYLKHAGLRAKPLTHGSMKHHLAATVGSLIAGEVLSRLPVGRRGKRFTRAASSIATLIGGFSLRWAMIHGARDAANDPHLARLATTERKPQITQIPPIEMQSD